MGIQQCPQCGAMVCPRHFTYDEAKREYLCTRCARQSTLKGA